MAPASQETMDLVRIQINNQIDLIETAIKKIQKNQIIDLQSMEAKMNILCFRIDQLDDEDLTQFEPFLDMLTVKLNELEDELAKFQDRMGIEMKVSGANTNEKQDSDENSDEDDA